MSKFWVKLFIWAAIAVFILSSFAMFTLAQETPGQGLQISPSVVELSADPGQSVSASIKLTNITESELIARAQANDFIAQGEGGEPKILFEETQESKYSMKNWFVLPQPLRLAPKQTQTVPVVINVPANASPGGHFGVIRFTGSAPELEESGVGLSASIGTLVLLNVSGDVRESLKIEEFYIGGQCRTKADRSKDCKRGSFFEYGPIQIVQRLRNDGNVHIKPGGDVEVFNVFGRKIAGFKLNDTGRNILPDSVRKFEQDLGKKLLIGKYKVKLTLVYGKDNRMINSETDFWVIPYRLLGLLLILLIVLLYVFRSSIRAYNRRIIKRYSGR